MAALCTQQGLQRIGINASQATAYASARFIQTMAWDDSTVAFAATDTALNTGGAVTNEYDQAFDATPTRAAQTISHVSTIPTGQGNFTIKRLSLSDDTAANTTTSSTTLVAGVDGQSLAKTSSFSLATTLALAYS